MLIPKLKLHSTEDENGNMFCSNKYFVYDTETNEFIGNRTFTFYDTLLECQEAIDFYNSFKVVDV